MSKAQIEGERCTPLVNNIVNSVFYSLDNDVINFRLLEMHREFFFECNYQISWPYIVVQTNNSHTWFHR